MPKGYGYRILLLSKAKDSLVLLKDGRVDSEINLAKVKFVEPTRKAAEGKRRGEGRWFGVRVVGDRQVTEFAIEGLPLFQQVIQDIQVLVRSR